MKSYQLKGDIVLKTVQNDEIVDVPILEGNILMLPPKVPHSPQRPDPESIGMVIERIRPEGKGPFEWYCANCGTKPGKRSSSKHCGGPSTCFEEYYSKIAIGNCKNWALKIHKKFNYSIFFSL